MWGGGRAECWVGKCVGKFVATMHFVMIPGLHFHIPFGNI